LETHPTHLKYPGDADLRGLLRFQPDEGSIWLGDRRMVLLHTVALGSLRQDLISSMGPEHARRILTRMGYACGMRDAEFAKRLRGDRPAAEMFLVGPQLHMLEGAAKVTPLANEVDLEAGRFYGEYRWDHSWEAHAHRERLGLAEEPACWTLLGYASGYTSAFMGRLVLFKETVCAACGADHCHIVGRPIEEWPDGEAHRAYFVAAGEDRGAEPAGGGAALQPGAGQRRAAGGQLAELPPCAGAAAQGGRHPGDRAADR
jgi:predicted hydrocarbon binding protein